MKIQLVLFFVLIPFASFPQTLLSPWALKSRQRADSVVNTLLNKEAASCPIIVFSAADKFFIVEVKKNDGFYEYYFERESRGRRRAINKTIFSISDKLKKKMFDTTIYRKGYITYESDFFKSPPKVASGGITYFVLKDENGKRFGEARLSEFVYPNPIDPHIYLYFVQKLDEYLREFR